MRPWIFVFGILVCRCGLQGGFCRVLCPSLHRWVMCSHPWRFNLLTDHLWFHLDPQESSICDAPPTATAYSLAICLFTTRLNCREQIGSRQCSVHCTGCPTHIVKTRSTPSDSLKAATWCLLSVYKLLHGWQPC